MIKDSVARICFQSSAKILKFLLPAIRDQLKAGGTVVRSAFVVDAWCRYAEGIDEKGNKYPIQDDMGKILHEMSVRSHNDPLAFLRTESVFGDLISSEKLTNAYVNALQCIYQKGVAGCITEINSKKLINP